MDPLQEIVDSLSGVETHLLAELPQFKPVKGLPEFLQALRNAGMNPHLAGEIKQLANEPEAGGLSVRLS